MWERRRSGLGMTDKKSFGRIEEIVYGGLAGMGDALRMEYGHDLHIAIIRDIRRIFISQVAFCFNRLNKTDALRLADGIVKDLYRQFSQKSLAFNGGELYAKDGILFIVLYPRESSKEINANPERWSARGADL